jgi:hypothetical protein
MSPFIYVALCAYVTSLFECEINFQGATYSCFLELNHFETNGDSAHSRSNSIIALERNSTGQAQKMPHFLKYVHAYGGVVRVIDFLKTTLDDEECIGAIRMECIKKAATAIKRITYAGDDDNDEGIVKMIATSVADFKGIETVLLASNEYTGGDDIAHH